MSNDKSKYNSRGVSAFNLYPKRAIKQLAGMKSITEEAQRRLTWILIITKGNIFTLLK